MDVVVVEPGPFTTELFPQSLGPEDEEGRAATYPAIAHETRSGQPYLSLFQAPRRIRLKNQSVQGIHAGRSQRVSRRTVSQCHSGLGGSRSVSSGACTSAEVSAVPLEPSADFGLEKAKEIRTAVLELMSAGTQPPIHSLGHLAHKLRLSKQEVEQVLFDLVRTGEVRTNRPEGTLKKTYSLSDSPENRLLDTFVASLGEVLKDDRHIRHRNVELDASGYPRAASRAMNASGCITTCVVLSWKACLRLMADC